VKIPGGLTRLAGGDGTANILSGMHFLIYLFIAHQPSRVPSVDAIPDCVAAPVNCALATMVCAMRGLSALHPGFSKKRALVQVRLCLASGCVGL